MEPQRGQPQQPAVAANPSDVLVVDLDDTLVRTDLLVEQVLKLVRSKPLLAFALPLWLLRGRVHLKTQLATHTLIDAARLPYRESVLDLVKEARAKGQRVLLASASHERVVGKIFTFLGCFDAYLASRDENLKGARKLTFIRDYLQGAKFRYIGDASADLPIWREAEAVVAVNPGFRLKRRIDALGKPTTVLRDAPKRLPLVIRQMRVHQWVKNMLVLVPLLASHHFVDVPAWRAAGLAFLAFSMMASAVYVLNDLLDVDADRAHYSKKRRPFASGDLPLATGFVLLPVLLTGAFGVAAFLPWDVTALLGLYLTLNMAYSLKLKETVILDTMMLTSFYALRVLVGGAAADVRVSQWLLAFSFFFFLGLAMVKRYTELLRHMDKATLDRRGYRIDDMLPVFVMGVASSFLAVLVLVLYTSSHDVERLYARPDRLWLMAPCLTYWSARIWLMAHRGQVDDDPVLFSMRDAVSWLVVVVTGAILALAL